MTTIFNNRYVLRQENAARVLNLVCDSVISDSFDGILTPKNGWLLARISYPEYQISLIDKENDSLDLLIVHTISGSQYLFPLDYDLNKGRTLNYCVKKFSKIALTSFEA